MKRIPIRRAAALSLSGLLCVLALSLAGCSEKIVRVGAVLPIQGPDAIYGEAVQEGMELAYEEIQANPEDYPTQIELEIVDSESDPEKAKELLAQQYDEGALLAIGGVTSREAKEMIAVAETYDRVLLSPTASSPELSGLSRNFYRIWPSDFAAARRMAQFVSQDLEIDELVVLAEEQQTYAKGIQGAFESAYEGYGGKVTEAIEFPPNTGDVAGLIERVMTLKPKAVYVAAYGEAIGNIIEELRNQGYEGKILTTSAFASPRFIAPLGDDAAGVILTQSVFELDSDHAHVQTFVESYEAKYGEPPDIFAAHGYDAMKVIAAAVQGRPAIPSEVPKGLREIKDFPGVTGSIQFNEQGDVLKYPRIYIIGKDALLYDYTERVRQQQDEIRKRREELRKRLEEIQRKAEELKEG